jgi:hypothetical protein
MSRAKNVVANGNAARYSDNRRNLNPFRPLPLRTEKENIAGTEKVVSALPTPKVSIVLIMDEMGARTVKRIPRGIIRNLDMFQVVEEKDVLMFIKNGISTAKVTSHVDEVDGELHPLETVQEAPFDYYYDEGVRSHHHKRNSKLNAGAVVRKMDRQLRREAFVA